MADVKVTAMIIAGFAGSILSFLFGGWTEALTTLLIFMVLDYVTGLVCAGVFHASTKTPNGKLESNACLKGLWRKGMTLLYVIIATRLDMVLGTTYIRDGVCIAFIANEVISICENGVLMGVPMPGVIKNALEIMTKEDHAHGSKED
jgi:toxin secretion/phage lysis holin